MSRPPRRCDNDLLLFLKACFAAREELSTFEPTYNDALDDATAFINNNTLNETTALEYVEEMLFNNG